MADRTPAAVAMMGRGAVAWSLALALSACNAMISTSPILTSADSSVDLRIKAGLWREASCQAAARPPPGCHDVVVTLETIGDVYDPKLMAKLPKEEAGKLAGPWPYVISDGRPPVLQLQVPQMGAMAKDGPDNISQQDRDLPGYAFFGIQPLRRDAEGRVVRLGAWQVLCGPPRRDKESAGSKVPAAVLARRLGGPTEHPFPGVILTGMSCQPADLPALRGAAAASRQYAERPMELLWIGDASPPR